MHRCDSDGLHPGVLPQARISPLSRRAAIVALADARIGFNTIARLVGCSLSSVQRWIRRAKGAGALQDHPRSGRPALYAQELQLRLVAFYCQTRPLPGAGRWTLRWAERRLKADPGPVGAAPSKSTLHRILRSNRLKPHQSRYFLSTPEPDLLRRMSGDSDPQAVDAGSAHR
jgi:transposase